MSDSFSDDALEFELPDALELEIAGLESLPATEQAEAFDRLAAAHPKHASQIRFLQRMSASVESDVESHIGPYRIVRTLGEGGMGTVYLAEQEEPVSRVVARKVIKLGMDTNAILARFEHERQVLARDPRVHREVVDALRRLVLEALEDDVERQVLDLAADDHRVDGHCSYGHGTVTYQGLAAFIEVAAR